MNIDYSHLLVAFIAALPGIIAWFKANIVSKQVVEQQAELLKFKSM